MDKVLPVPVSPPVELLLLFRLCPKRGERGRRGERPGLPDTDPFPLDPTTSSFETERELPYMVTERRACTIAMRLVRQVSEVNHKHMLQSVKEKKQD